MDESITRVVTRPTTVQEYVEWHNARDGLGLIRPAHREHYDLVTSALLERLPTSPFWQDLGEGLREWHDAYTLKTGYPLLQDTDCPAVCSKPYDSLLDKVLRRNALQNGLFPDPPPAGWLGPDNWFEQVHDIIRTTVVVKYIDGVVYLVERLDDLCGQLGLSCRADLEAREEGYYAAHFCVQLPFRVPSIEWDTEERLVWLEIQVTTQLQDVIKRLLHHYYERTRASAWAGSSSWKWDYGSDEFATNYLGHILHYVEGMIADIRDRQQEADSNEGRVRRVP